MNFYPTIESLTNSTEEVRLELRRSPRSMLGLLSWSILVFFLVTVINVTIPDYRALLIYLIPCAMTVEALRRYHDDVYQFTADEVIHQGGRLSLHYSVPSVRYVDIRSISVYQTFTGILFDFGNLVLNTAAKDSGELFIEGVRAPDELALLIEEIRLILDREGRATLGRAPIDE